MKALLGPVFRTCEIQIGPFLLPIYQLIQNGLSGIKVKLIDLNRYKIIMELSIPNQGKVTKM